MSRDVWEEGERGPCRHRDGVSGLLLLYYKDWVLGAVILRICQRLSKTQKSSFGLKRHAMNLSPDETASHLCPSSPSLSVVRDCTFGWTTATDPSSCVAIRTFLCTFELVDTSLPVLKTRCPFWWPLSMLRWRGTWIYTHVTAVSHLSAWQHRQKRWLPIISVSLKFCFWALKYVSSWRITTYRKIEVKNVLILNRSTACF